MTNLRKLAVPALLALGLTIPTTTAAQRDAGQPASSSSSSLSFSVFGFPVPITGRSIPERWSGQLTVSFHGDPATGCAPAGLCGYSGVVSWRPQTAGSLLLVGYRAHRRVEYEVLSGIESLLNGPGDITTAEVTRAATGGIPASSCLDAAGDQNPPTLQFKRGRLALSPAAANPQLLATRCAAPLTSDIAPYLPTPVLTLQSLTHGPRTVSLAASASFASHGLAGEISSTLALSLGRPGRSTHFPQQRLLRTKQRRYRVATVSYRAVLNGSVTEQVQGATDPLVCAPLDSCGATGTTTLTPKFDGNATITLSALASGRWRNLLAPHVLGSRGATGHIAILGSVQTAGGGSASAEITQGTNHCVDSGTFSRGGLLIASAGTQVGIDYSTASNQFSRISRCPGPNQGAIDFLAGGRLRRTALSHRKVRIKLDIGKTFTDAGYQVRVVPHLTLTLTRIRVRTRIVPEPFGPISG